MYNIIPLILILISLVIIIFLTLRKFPLLANLDMENIPAEKEAKFKEQILSNRLKRNYIKWSSRLLKIINPIGTALSEFFNWSVKKLQELRENYKKDPILNDTDLNQIVVQLFSEADELIKKEEFDEAEKKLIEIVGIDNRNIKAFEELGDIYARKKDFAEARQTYEYILKLKGDKEDIESDPANSKIYFDLADVYKAMDNMESAMTNVKKALRLEPSNPRYLDTMLEISIIIKDKVSALDALERLAEANPDNQKLEEFRRQVEEL